MAVSGPTATLSETKNHSSIPHQNKLKDQKHTTVFPLLTPLHSQSSRLLLPNHADVKKNLEKGINQRVSVHNIFLKALHSLNKKLQPPFGQ